MTFHCLWCPWWHITLWGDISLIHHGNRVWGNKTLTSHIGNEKNKDGGPEVPPSPSRTCPHWNDDLPWGALTAKCPTFHLSKAPRSIKPQVQTTETLQVFRERNLDKWVGKQCGWRGNALLSENNVYFYQGCSFSESISEESADTQKYPTKSV